MLVGGGRSPRSRRRLRLPRQTIARRGIVLLGVYLVLLGGVVYRLVDIQVVNADEYAARGELQRARTLDLPARRGRVYDRNGDVLATSVQAATVYADPRAYRPQPRDDGLVVPPAGDAATVAQRLGPVLDQDPAVIEERLHRDAHFVYLARQIDEEVGRRIAAMELPGIGILAEPRRIHPAGPLAGQVVGFTGIDGNGLAGLELQYDNLLSGRPGELALERAPGGLAIASAPRELVPPVSGTDVVLTLDREIQHVAEKVAANAVEEHDAAGASVLVLEVGSGEVLAMASAPGFDPNELDAVRPEVSRNRAVTDRFEPGSVQKAVTAAAALEAGITDVDHVYRVDDAIRIGGKTFTDAHRHPTEEMTLREIIEQSSNVGTIMLARELGAERLAAALEDFGYGEPLGVGFPGEVAGSFLPVEQWSATSLPTMAIGHGLAVTLLQAANVYATLANDGVAVQPRLVRGTVGDDGHLTAASPPASHRVVSAASAAKVRDMLRGVIAEERGTGARAAVPGYDVAGKTGTARKPLDGARGYSGDYIASFVGFAPVSDPRLVVAVMVDEPTPIYGGVVAAPAFSDVMGFALQHRRVPPNRPADAAPSPAPSPSTAAAGTGSTTAP